MTIVRERQGKYVFRSYDRFPNGVLLKTDILQKLLQERNWIKKSTATYVANELAEGSTHCNVYRTSVEGIISRIEKLVKDFRIIDS